MVELQEDIFYYLTVTNENYAHPVKPEGSEEGVLRGMYRFKDAGTGGKVQLLGSGAILHEVLAAARLLEQDFNIGSDVWSVTSFTELRREGLECERWNRHHPQATPKVSYVSACLNERSGPVIAASDYMKAYADQIRCFVPRRYVVLGTDGYGRSDTRTELREFFEISRYYIAVAALKTLADEGGVPHSIVIEALRKYGVDPEKPSPVNV